MIKVSIYKADQSVELTKFQDRQTIEVPEWSLLQWDTGLTDPNETF